MLKYTEKYLERLNERMDSKRRELHQSHYALVAIARFHDDDNLWCRGNRRLVDRDAPHTSWFYEYQHAVCEEEFSEIVEELQIVREYAEDCFYQLGIISDRNLRFDLISPTIIEAYGKIGTGNWYGNTWEEFKHYRQFVAGGDMEGDCCRGWIQLDISELFKE